MSANDFGLQAPAKSAVQAGIAGSCSGLGGP
jgi:hypothetical protein